MNLPKIEPIKWKKQKPDEELVDIPVRTQFVSIPPRDDVRHDYFNPQGILAIHYPGIPELIL